MAPARQLRYALDVHNTKHLTVGNLFAGVPGLLPLALKHPSWRPTRGHTHIQRIVQARPEHAILKVELLFKDQRDFCDLVLSSLRTLCC